MDLQECEQHPLPWFGSIQGLVLVPSEHSLDARIEPAALITLNEGGQLIVYDMKTLRPLPLSLPCQELPPITASAFVHDAPTPEVGHWPCRPAEYMLLLYHAFAGGLLPDAMRMPCTAIKLRTRQQGRCPVDVLDDQLQPTLETLHQKTLQKLLAIQKLPAIRRPVTVLNISPSAQEGEEQPHAFTVADLRTLHAASAASPERAAAHRWRWMLNGGKLPALDSMCEVSKM